MKVTSKSGKQYEYQYKQIFLKAEVLDQFNELRKSSGVTYSELLTQLMTKK